MVKSAAVPVMVRAVPRACGASQQHAKKFVTGSQQWSVGAGSAERSCNTNPMTPSTNQGLRPNTSSLRPVCHGTAAVLSAPHVAHITANSFASMRKMSSAAQHRQAEDGSQGQQGWNASAAWALGCASIVAGLGHVLSEDNVKAEAAPAPTAVAVAVATIDTVPEALETIAKLGGSPAKDIPSAIKLVASKALLDNASHEVRRDTLLALAVLLSTKEGEANVSVLLKAGAVKSCFTILSDASSSPETLAGAATLLANLNTFQGGWFCSPAHKEKDWQAAVKMLLFLTVDSYPAFTKLAATSAIGKILGTTSAQFLDASVTQAAVRALSLLLGREEDDEEAAQLRSAALEGLRHASDSKAGVVAVGESPTQEGLIASMGAEQEQDAVFAIETVTNVAKIAPETAERICLAGAVQGAVNGAMQHRGSLAAREAVAELLETMVNSKSEDVIMRVAHYATPVVVALARTQDEQMQLRAVEVMRKLCLNGMNKFTMQKNFEVIPDLVVLLSRENVTQQAVISECLAHLASTDNAYYGENARVLGEARGMKPLMVLAKSRDQRVHRNATWALACMTACERNHVPMRAAIDTLLQVVERGSPAAQRFAVMAISNLAATPRTREMLAEKGAEGILRKCAQANSGDRMITELIRTTALVNLKRGGKSVFNIPPPN